MPSIDELRALARSKSDVGTQRQLSGVSGQPAPSAPAASPAPPSVAAPAAPEAPASSEAEVQAPAGTPADSTEVAAPVVISLPPALTAPIRKGANMATNMLDDIDPVEVGTAIASALATSQQQRAQQREAAQQKRITDLASAFVAGLTGDGSATDVVDPSAGTPDATGTAAPVAAPAPLRGTLAPPAPVVAPTPAPAPAPAPTAATPVVTDEPVAGVHIPLGLPVYGKSKEAAKRPWKAYGPYSDPDTGQVFVYVEYDKGGLPVRVLKSVWDNNTQQTLELAGKSPDGSSKGGVVGKTRKILFGG